MLHAIVHSADIQDRDGGVLVMTSLFGAYPFLLKLYADGGYQGAAFQAGMKKALKNIDVEIVKRSDQQKGFVVLPKRWVVERTFAWLNRCRSKVGPNAPSSAIGPANERAKATLPSATNPSARTASFRTCW